MVWQDIIIAICNFVMFLALIPSIKSTEKPILSTSIITASAVTVIAITLRTLSLQFAFISTALIAIGWWTLTLQNLMRKKKDKKLRYKM